MDEPEIKGCRNPISASSSAKNASATNRLDDTYATEVEGRGKGGSGGGRGSAGGGVEGRGDNSSKNLTQSPSQKSPSLSFKVSSCIYFCRGVKN